MKKIILSIALLGVAFGNVSATEQVAAFVNADTSTSIVKQGEQSIASIKNAYLAIQALEKGFVKFAKDYIKGTKDAKKQQDATLCIKNLKINTGNFGLLVKIAATYEKALAKNKNVVTVGYTAASDMKKKIHISKKNDFVGFCGLIETMNKITEISQAGAIAKQDFHTELAALLHGNDDVETVRTLIVDKMDIMELKAVIASVKDHLNKVALNAKNKLKKLNSIEKNIAAIPSTTDIMPLINAANSAIHSINGNGLWDKADEDIKLWLNYGLSNSNASDTPVHTRQSSVILD